MNPTQKLDIAAGDPRELPSPLDVPDEMWSRYSTRAPRYTSYPTAPQFHEGFDRDAALGQYRDVRNKRRISLYVHVPYCERRCLYCGCHLFIKKDRSVGGPYVDRLLHEAAIVAEHTGGEADVEQLALGGGTPNFLQVEDMRRLVEGLRALWRFPEGGERSIEIDVRTVDNNYIDALLDLGFNRFSLGVQDLNVEVIDRLRKNQTADYVGEVVEHLRSRGVMKALNFDLMYGLPGQTPETMADTVATVVGMRPSRIALFGYAHVPWIKPHQAGVEKLGLPGDQERVALWGTAFNGFREAGYVPVGMDHFAEPEDELYIAQRSGVLHRNFMGYTTKRGLDQIGLGVSSISAVGAAYVQNEKDVDPYHADIDGGRLPWTKGFNLSDDDRMRRELIIDLFANFQLDIPAFEKTWGVRFWDAFSAERARLEPMAADGLMTMSDEAIRVKPIGRFFIRNVCMVFDRYLGEGTQRFSKTV